MANYANEPLRFGSVSMVTLTLGTNDPELGARTTDSSGEYIFVYNAGNSIIDKGMAAVLSGVSGYSVTVSATTSNDFVVGVCKHGSLATAAYGWLLTRGFVEVEMDGTSGTVSKGGLIEISDAGVWSPVSNTTGNKAPAQGKMMEAVVSGASGTAYISVF